MSTLLAGAARTCITPPVGTPLAGYFAAEGRNETARETHDELYARALVIGDGDTTLAIVTTDLLGIGDDIVSSVRDVVAREVAIPGEHLIIACTHTHSGPVTHAYPATDLLPGQADEDYLRVLPRLVGGAVIMAARNMRPARLGAGTGTCEININRREFLPDGTLRGLPFLGRNPEGTVDRQVGVVRVDDAGSGQPLALLVDYPCHPVVLGPNTAISADYVGYTCSMLERSLGHGVVALFANGAQGDMNPIVHPGEFADAERLGTILGAEVLRVALGITTEGEGRLAAATSTRELPLNPDSDPERQREYMAFLHHEYEHALASSDSLRAWDYEMRLAVAEYRLYAREHLDTPYLGAEVTAFGVLGPRLSVGLVSEPAELFCTYGMQTRDESPFATTLVIGLANGMIGYVPTPQVYTEGGYECEATNVGPDAGEQLCRAMVEALRAASQSATNG